LARPDWSVAHAAVTRQGPEPELQLEVVHEVVLPTPVGGDGTKALGTWVMSTPAGAILHPMMLVLIVAFAWPTRRPIALCSRR
jgi:hypothetical protein